MMKSSAPPNASVDLPPLVAAYVEATNSFNLERLMATFAEDALVNDQFRDYWGKPTIREWAKRDIIGERLTMNVTKVINHYGNFIVTRPAKATIWIIMPTIKWGKPFTVDGFSGWMRDAMTDAGLPLDCRPHGLRKTFGRLLADAGATAHDIMAALGHLTLGEAERYTREADRRHGGRRAIVKLEDYKANRIPQTSSVSLGKLPKSRGESK